MNQFTLYDLTDGKRVELGGAPTVDGLVAWAENCESQRGMRVEIVDQDGVVVFP
jgi:hypothetical protein